MFVSIESLPSVIWDTVTNHVVLENYINTPGVHFSGYCEEKKNRPQTERLRRITRSKSITAVTIRVYVRVGHFLFEKIRRRGSGNPQRWPRAVSRYYAIHAGDDGRVPSWTASLRVRDKRNVPYSRVRVTAEFPGPEKRFGSRRRPAQKVDPRSRVNCGIACACTSALVASGRNRTPARHGGSLVRVIITV